MTNPFHFLTAGPDEFVGRWPLVRAISDELVNGVSSYGIVGGKRCGKSSVLGMIQHLLQYDDELGGQALTLLLDPMEWEGELDRLPIFGPRFCVPWHWRSQRIVKLKS
ncbi:MAG: hypothetical protein R3E79_24150 [Caldilineaceae bacterium]